SSLSTNVIPPPPDVKPIIDKLAEYVARNGPAFEQSIRTKNDPRFGFLEPDHIHHNYYQLKVQLCVQDILRKKTEENQRPINNDEQQSVHGKGVKLVLKVNTEESLTPTCQEFNSDDDSNSMQQSNCFISFLLTFVQKLELYVTIVFEWEFEMKTIEYICLLSVRLSQYLSTILAL
ncbi:unnamed protein product, partial [Rotaria sp. Silwood2]